MSNRLSSLLPFAAVALVVLAAIVWIPTLTSCGLGSGACVGTGGIVDECKEGWTRAECEEWDSIGVNGANWTFHSGGSCSDLGYSVRCPDGSYVHSASDC